MSAIGPGDWVECVDAGPSRASVHTGAPMPLILGGVYKIRAVCRRGESLCLGHRATDAFGEVLLQGVSYRHPWGPDWPISGSRFRPIYRPKADLIESLKRPALEDA